MLAKNEKQDLRGRLALLGTTLIWGTSFVILKATLDSIPALYILAFRFTGAAVLMLIPSARALKSIDKGYLKGGAIMGACLFFAYVLQTYGLSYTTPGKNAFLTAGYCVLVPFFNWAIAKKRPDRFNLIAALMCIFGVGFVSLQSDLSVNPGDALTTVCGIFYALHIIATDKYAAGRNAAMITMVQFGTCAVLAWAASLVSGPLPTAIPGSAALSVVYLCVMCTAICFFLQTYGQKYTPASAVAIILPLESVFGALISVIFYHEALTVNLIIGFALIFVSVMISETKLEFLRKNYHRSGGAQADQ